MPSARDEILDLVLSPVAIVLRGRGANKPAVPAVLAGQHRDVRIVRDLGLAKSLRRNEWVVLGGDDQGRKPDAIDDAHRAGAMVIVLGVLEAEVRRRVRFVELAHRANPAELGEVEQTGPALLLATHPALEILHEV